MNYNGMYALIDNGAIIRIDSKPYLPDAGFPVWRPIIDRPPQINWTQAATANPQASWTIGADAVAVTYMITDRPLIACQVEALEQIRNAAWERIIKKYPLWY